MKEWTLKCWGGHRINGTLQWLHKKIFLSKNSYQFYRLIHCSHLSITSIYMTGSYVPQTTVPKSPGCLCFLVLKVDCSYPAQNIWNWHKRKTWSIFLCDMPLAIRKISLLELRTFQRYQNLNGFGNTEDRLYFGLLLWQSVHLHITVKCLPL